MTSLLSVRDLDVTFPGRTADQGVPAVRRLSYDVASGEVLGIVGESGSGKSVSSLAVMGLLPDRARVSGSIRFDGQEMLGLSDRELSDIRGRRIAMVFQDPLSALTPVYTVGAQVAEAVRRHHDVTRAQADRRAVELLDLVGIPRAGERAASFPHEFSGGMRQRVVIAIAVANDPELIIADEPTTALDVTVQAQVLDVLATAREVTGAALVLITHDLGVVAGQADRVMVMYAGRAVESGGADTVFATPRMPYTRGLLESVPRIDAGGIDGSRRRLLPIEGSPPSPADLPPGCPFGPRCPLHVEACDEAEPALVEVEPGHEAACLRSDELGAVVAAPEAPEAPAATSTPDDDTGADAVLVLDDLVRHYAPRRRVFRRAGDPVRAVDGISLELRAGETLGLVGESGCGKTTTLHEILELGTPQSGRIEVLGHDTATLDTAARRALRRDLQVVFQDPMASLDPRLPMRDLVAEPLQLDGWSRAAVDARVAELVELVGLSVSQLDRYPAQFSGGQRQRIGIARALALRPRILVLDEPVSALDVSIQAGVLNLLDELRTEFGLAYLFVAHDLSVIRYVADRVAVMYLGRIVEVGSVSSIFSSPSHPYTRALLSAVPVPDPPVERARARTVLAGDMPSPADPPSGCRFRTRCPLVLTLDDDRQARCVDDDPALHVLAGGHQVACHFGELMGADPALLTPRADPAARLTSPEVTR